MWLPSMIVAKYSGSSVSTGTSVRQQRASRKPSRFSRASVASRRLEAPRPRPALQRLVAAAGEHAVQRAEDGLDVARPAALRHERRPGLQSRRAGARTARRGRAPSGRSAVESTASTGSGSSSCARSATWYSTRSVAEPLARLLDHRRRAVDGDHPAVRQALEQRLGHAAGAAARVEHRLVAAQLEPRAARRAPSPRSAPTCARTSAAFQSRVMGAVTIRSASSAARRHELAHLRRRLAPGAEDVAGDDVRVGGVRPADADADAVEVRAAEVALEGLQAVVAGEAAAERASGCRRTAGRSRRAARARGRGRACRRRAPGRPRGRTRS